MLRRRQGRPARLLHALWIATIGESPFENGTGSALSGSHWATGGRSSRRTRARGGYGDIVPRTALGRLLSALVMILGYSIIAVPTGIVSVELSHASQAVSTQHCPSCARYGHDADARHCKYCGAAL